MVKRVILLSQDRRQNPLSNIDTNYSKLIDISKNTFIVLLFIIVISVFKYKQNIIDRGRFSLNLEFSLRHSRTSNKYSKDSDFHSIRIVSTVVPSCLVFRIGQ